MRKLAVVISAVAVLALAGCTEAPDPEPTEETGTAVVVSDPKAISTVEEGIDFVLAQAPGTMTANEAMDAALKLRPLVEAEFSDAALGDIPRRLLAVTLDGLEYGGSDPAPELQAELADIVKEIRELG